jgi:hypothetical protein
MLRVDLVGSRRIEPAHVGRPFGPDGSRRIQKDRQMIKWMTKAHPTENRMAGRAVPQVGRRVRQSRDRKLTILLAGGSDCCVVMYDT